MPYHHVDQVVNALFVGSKNKQIKNGLKRLFTPYGYDRQKSVELTHELLKKCDISSDSTAVQLSMDEIRAICYSYKQIQESENFMAISTRDNKIDDEDEADLLCFKSDNEKNFEIPTDPKYVVQF